MNKAQYKVNKAQGEMSRRLISKEMKKERTRKHRKEWKVKEEKAQSAE